MSAAADTTTTGTNAGRAQRALRNVQFSLDESDVITLTSALADYADKVLEDAKWCGCPNEAENLREHARDCVQLRDEIERQRTAPIIWVRRKGRVWEALLPSEPDWIETGYMAAATFAKVQQGLESVPANAACKVRELRYGNLPPKEVR